MNGEEKEKMIPVALWLRVENNSKFMRGKQSVRARREDVILSQYTLKKPRKEGWEDILTLLLRTDEELDTISYDLLQEADSLADRRYYFIEADGAALDGEPRSW